MAKKTAQQLARERLAQNAEAVRAYMRRTPGPVMLDSELTDTLRMTNYNLWKAVEHLERNGELTIEREPC